MAGTDREYSQQWSNDEVRVDIPFSAAGVGTTIVLTSRFTDRMMLLDVGDGAVRDLLSIRNSSDWVGNLDLVAISHGHFDHVGGLHTLLSFMRMLQRREALNVLIPKKCAEAITIVKGYRSVYLDTLPYETHLHELSDGSGFDTDFFKVQAFGVEHYSLEHGSPDVLIPALGYRVRIGTTTVAYTGDTRLCPAAEAVVEGADLAIIEATRGTTPSGLDRVHLSVEEATRLGARAKDFLLIHRIPQYPKWTPSEEA
ncbi:MAG: MBL fold metallo-hydrolase [Candidatus Thorarchaeota archaeon]